MSRHKIIIMGKLIWMKMTCLKY